MAEEYGSSYWQIFGAAFSAGVEAAQELPDPEIEELARYSGIVGLVAEHVRQTRNQQAGPAKSGSRRSKTH